MKDILPEERLFKVIQQMNGDIDHSDIEENSVIHHPKKKQSKTFLLTGLCVIIIIGLILGIYYYLNYLPESEESQEEIVVLNDTTEAVREPEEIIPDTEKVIENAVPAEEPIKEVPFVSYKGLRGMAENLKLVGISQGEISKAMIRDKKRENTYFLKEGDEIGMTGIRVKRIFKDRVIIGYGEEEMEML